MLLVCVAACAHVPVTAQPATLVAHAGEFRAQGYARVEVDQGGTAAVSGETVITIDVPGNERSHLWGLVKTGHPDQIEPMTIANFVAGCPACVATRAQGPIHVGERRELDGRLLALGLFGAAATAGSITCLAECTNPGGWAYVGTVLAAIVMLVPLASTF